MKRNIWDILAWVALAVLLLWIILKLAGVIKSPLIIEIIPYISAAYFIGRMFQKIETTANDVNSLKKEVYGIDKRLQTLEIKNNLRK